MRRLAAFAAIIIVLSACGPATSDFPSAVAQMRQVFQAYNAARPVGLAATGATCRKAATNLSQVRGISAPVPGTPSAAANHLKSVYHEALDGFRLCAKAASALDYAAMSKALARISAANADLTRARSGSH